MKRNHKIQTEPNPDGTPADGKQILRWSGEFKTWLPLVRCATKREAIEHCACLNGDRAMQFKVEQRKTRANGMAFNCAEVA